MITKPLTTDQIRLLLVTAEIALMKKKGATFPMESMRIDMDLKLEHLRTCVPPDFWTRCDGDACLRWVRSQGSGA